MKVFFVIVKFWKKSCAYFINYEVFLLLLLFFVFLFFLFFLLSMNHRCRSGTVLLQTILSFFTVARNFRITYCQQR